MIQWLKKLFLGSEPKKASEPEPIVEEEIIEIVQGPAPECYSRSDMFLFSGYLMGKKENEPGINVTEVFEEWKLRFKNQ